MEDTEQDALGRIAHHFTRFAEIDGQDDALYCALAAAIADDRALMAPLLEAPATQRKPVLFFAALHDRILAGSALDDPHPLAAYYASVGGHGRRTPSCPARCAISFDTKSRRCAR